MPYNTTPQASVRKGNTGMQNFTGPKGKIVKILGVPKGTEIATKTLALTLATWTANLNATMASRWLMFPIVIDIEAPDPAIKYDETGYGNKEFVTVDKPVVTYFLESMSTYNKVQLNQNDLASLDFYEITEYDKICGWTSDSVKFLPYTTNSVKILPESKQTGDKLPRIKVEITYNDISQFNGKEVVIDPTVDSEAPAAWYPTYELKGVKDIIFAVSGGSATGFTLVASGFDGTPVSGLVKEDLLIYKSTAPTVAIAATGCPESNSIPGQYAVTYATQTAGTFAVSMRQPDATTMFFETPSSVSLIWS